jgi:hypothetical protein
MKKMVWIAAVAVLVALSVLPAQALPPYCECEICTWSHCTIPGTWVVIRCSTYMQQYCEPLRAAAQAEAPSVDEFLTRLADSHPERAGCEPGAAEVPAE